MEVIEKISNENRISVDKNGKAILLLIEELNKQNRKLALMRSEIDKFKSKINLKNKSKSQHHFKKVVKKRMTLHVELLSISSFDNIKKAELLFNNKIIDVYHDSVISGWTVKKIGSNYVILSKGTRSNTFLIKGTVR